MAIAFNIIACMVPLVGALEIEVAGRLMGQVLRDAIRCPECGVLYSLIVPAGAPERQLSRETEEMREYVSSTCGNHPPIIQKQ